MVDLLRSLCKYGLPTNNVFEFAALTVLKFEKKWKLRKRKELQERIKNREMEKEKKKEEERLKKEAEEEEKRKEKKRLAVFSCPNFCVETAQGEGGRQEVKGHHGGGQEGRRGRRAAQGGEEGTRGQETEGRQVEFSEA